MKGEVNRLRYSEPDLTKYLQFWRPSGPWARLQFCFAWLVRTTYLTEFLFDLRRLSVFIHEGDSLSVGPTLFWNSPLRGKPHIRPHMRVPEHGRLSPLRSGPEVRPWDAAPVSTSELETRARRPESRSDMCFARDHVPSAGLA